MKSYRLAAVIYLLLIAVLSNSAVAFDRMAGSDQVSMTAGAASVVSPVAAFTRERLASVKPPQCRTHPKLGIRRNHAGCDMTIKAGTPVRATTTGRIVEARYSESAGNMVIIEHKAFGKTFYSKYFHLTTKGRGCALPKKGTRVQTGQNIGCVGSTGLSTGPHLHFEVRGGMYDGTIYDSKHFVLTGGTLKPAAGLCGGGKSTGSKRNRRRR